METAFPETVCEAFVDGLAGKGVALTQPDGTRNDPMSDSRHLRFEAVAALAFFIGVELRSADVADRPDAPRRASSWDTEVLAAELPKYVPRSLTSETEATIAAEPAVEKDGVLALPTMTVRSVIKESPSDYAFLTLQGRLELAMKTRPGLRIGNLLGLNHGIAMFMQLEEQEVRGKAALLNRVDRVINDDNPDSRETLRMLKSALGRANASWLKDYSDR